MAITVMQIDETMKVAKRFVEAGAKARKAINDQREASEWCTGNCPKECGSVRRASMDLTRSLADLRRSK